MDAIASINNHKKNFFEFEMTVDGLDAEDAEVRYVIKYKPDFHLTFPCEKAEGDKWSVEIPPIPMLEKTAYNWCIEVVVDGYYFEGAKGMLNVVGAPEVYVKKPDAKKETTESKPAPKPERNDTRTKSREKPIKQLAQEMIEKQQAEKKQPVTESKAKKKVKPAAKKVETKKPEKIITEKKVEKKEPLKPEQKAEPKKPLVSPDEVRNIIKESARKAKKKRAKRSAQKPDRSTKVSKKTPVRNEPPKPVAKKKEQPVTEQEIAAKKLLEGLDAPVEDKKPKKKIAVKKGEQVVR